jgi:hypothetical protein
MDAAEGGLSTVTERLVEELLLFGPFATTFTVAVPE